MHLTLVVGSGRCGSTLLSRILRDHPDVLSVREVGTALVARRPGAPPAEIDGAAVWSLLTAPGDAPAAHVPDGLLDDLAPVVRGWPARPAAAHYRALLHHLAARSGRTTIVDHSTASLHLVATLHAAVPDAHLVHMYRDGPDCALSMSRHAWFRAAALTRHASRPGDTALPAPTPLSPAAGPGDTPPTPAVPPGDAAVTPPTPTATADDPALTPPAPTAKAEDGLLTPATPAARPGDAALTPPTPTAKVGDAASTTPTPAAEPENGPLTPATPAAPLTRPARPSRPGDAPHTRRMPAVRAGDAASAASVPAAARRETIPPGALGRVVPPNDAGAVAPDPIPLAVFGALWSSMIVDGVAALDVLPSALTSALRYEDLLRSPETTLTRLAATLHTSVDGDWLARARARVTPAAIGRSRALPPGELAALEAACRPGMKALGRTA
ncbi:MULTISPECIES: sulfotransferase [Catenuloplanes]|uniref:Sulfotransferase family protein n=1 Tax=Catenuloplanes niger TaxID=587534 RepID=A0AAE4CNR9_9ACTN|nr:sulfotransferase [Catenuloplanes niger]MDR7319766.1 hypothetical protein [Catenuloplanes niger]